MYPVLPKKREPRGGNGHSIKHRLALRLWDERVVNPLRFQRFSPFRRSVPQNPARAQTRT